MKTLISILTLCLGTVNLLAQSRTDKQIEMDLHNAYSGLLSYRFDNVVDWDSIAALNEIFKDKLLNYTSNYPSTLSYRFDSLQKDDIMIVTSEDKVFRIYSWGTGLGGTMQDFENVFQYRAEEKVFSTTGCDTATDEESVYVPFYSQIFSLHGGTQTYYLAVYNGIYASDDASQSIRVFTIENHSLIDTVNLIMTKSGLVNSIDVSFSFSGVSDRPERPLSLIKYDDESKIIYIPIVYEDGTVTNRFILYKFNGRYFEHFKTQKGRKSRL